MRTLKGWILTSVLLTTMAGSALANDGIIYGFAPVDDTTASTTTTTTTKTNLCTTDQSQKLGTGIIYGFTGIIYGFTGIIVTDFSSKEAVNCGIIYG